MKRTGRPLKNISDFREQIRQRIEDGESQGAVRDWLEREHGMDISIRTLRRNMSSWGMFIRKNSEITDQLRHRLTVLFFQGSMSDKKILETLSNEGFSIKLRTLAKLRKKMSLNKRVKPDVAPEDEDARVQQLLDTKFERSALLKYNKHSIYLTVRQMGYIASRDRLCRLLKKIKDEAKAAQQTQKNKEREAQEQAQQAQEQLDEVKHEHHPAAAIDPYPEHALSQLPDDQHFIYQPVSTAPVILQQSHAYHPHAEPIDPMLRG